MAHTHYAIIHRHGARYVCQDAFDLLANTEAVKHWQKDKIGLLTEVGIEQSEALGHHFGEIVLKDCSDPDFLWFSSDTERVVESGRAFLKGLKEKTTEEMFPRYTLDRYINDLPENLRLSGASSRLLQPREPSELFRAFKSNEAYIAEVREYFKGSTFAKQAEKEKEFLSEIIRIVLPEKAATMTLAEMLKAMDTLAGALECEFFCDSDTLINKLTPTQRDKVCSLARTIRQDIFFRLKTARTLGKPILDEILAYSRKSKVSIWSAHDHTLCSILASLGMKDYPTKSPNLIAFGAYLILEIKDNQTLHDAKFNPEPFMPSAKTTVCKDNESVIRLRKTVRG